MKDHKGGALILWDCDLIKRERERALSPFSVRTHPEGLSTDQKGKELSPGTLDLELAAPGTGRNFYCLSHLIFVVLCYV